MKSFERTQDVLDHARAFHKELQRLYQQLSTETEKERVKMLLEYLSRHEEHLEQSLSAYEAGASKRVLDTWFKYVPQEDKLQKFRDVKLEPEMSVDDVIEVALQMDNCLVDFYKDMAEVAVSQEVKEVFTNLLEMEEQEKHKLVRNALQLKEI